MNSPTAPKDKEGTLSLNEYQKRALGTEQKHDDVLPSLAFPLLGLFGEAGTLLSSLKKKQRDRVAYTKYKEDIVDDCGDILWYLCSIASKTSISLADLAKSSEPSTEEPKNRDQTIDLTFNEFQPAISSNNSAESAEFERSLLTLGSTVGLLMNDFQQGKLNGNSDNILTHLRTILSALAHASFEAGIPLSQIAEHNLNKINSRWPKEPQFVPLFDSEYDQWEQLPRQLEMVIIERKIEDRTYVVQQCRGINIGSQITDNKVEEDDYRFHDAFHLSYMAILGWSPVLRALFKVKRRSNPKVDAAEDGARAIAMEEGLSTLIFQRSLALKFFESVNSLDYSLLKLVADLVQGYEVAKCPPWQWEKAILEGFRIFRELKQNRGGKVSVDLEKHSITFSKLNSP